ncbi:hypothetical protein FRACA_4620001 [Frankia canadensis]|uniref:Uncharacterized protein n=1 Tax=Frankia canadensis TaxID=1836972 RepID=A0A2I2KXQ3_9ACTN|nr:hypothetical protein FRACA_4620001 [Frankia canadensis]SOU57734.1 hypothetical protein FRACA_4620001 [Frankia canadensis]
MPSARRPDARSGGAGTCTSASPWHSPSPRPFVLRVDVPPHRLRGDRADGRDEIRPGPQRRQPGTQVRELAPQFMGCEALDLVGDVRRGVLRVSLHEQVHMVGLDVQRDDRPVMLGALLPDQRVQPVTNLTHEDSPTVLRAPDDMEAEIIDPTRPSGHLPHHTGDYTSAVHLTIAVHTGFPCRPKAAVPSGGI